MKKILLSLVLFAAASGSLSQAYAECQTLKFEKKYETGLFFGREAAICYNNPTHDCGVVVCFLQQGMSQKIVKISVNHREVQLPPGVQEGFTTTQQAFDYVESRLENGIELK